MSMHTLAARSQQLVAKCKNAVCIYATSYQLPATSSSRGFTLLMAALVASVVLSIGIAIFNIVQKEVQLSAMGRDSQFAFYTADSAADCALYWDVRQERFASSSPPADVSCDGQTAPVSASTQTDPFGAWQSTTFSYEYAPGGLCTRVAVIKTRIGATVGTTIHADGFNVACAAVDTSNRALQRSVELEF